MNLTWHEDTMYGAWYSKINPYLDDRNGNAANENIITLVEDTKIAGGDNTYNHRANMSWVSALGNGAATTYHQSGQYRVKVFSPHGKVALEKTIGSANKYGYYGNHSYGYNEVKGNTLYFAWLDDRDGDDDVYVVKMDLSYDYYFPWYDCSSMTTWVHVTNPGASAASVSIYLAGALRETQLLNPGQDYYALYPGAVGGPVVVRSNQPVLTSQRSLYGSSFCEVPGTSDGNADSEVYFPWYDSIGMSTWIVVTNPVNANNQVEFYIGSNKMGTKTLAPNESYAVSYPSVLNGPVKLAAANGPIIACERTLYSASFGEVAGIPASSLSNTYYFPWYDNSLMQTWVLVGNPNNASVNVNISVDGAPWGAAALAAGETKYFQFPALVGGPVKVSATGDVFVSQRSLYGPSFCEVAGISNEAAGRIGYFPWYDTLGMKTWVLVGNPSTADTAYVDLWIGNGKIADDYAILPGKMAYFIVPGLLTGPVKVVSSNASVFMSERTLYPFNSPASFWEISGM